MIALYGIRGRDGKREAQALLSLALKETFGLRQTPEQARHGGGKPWFPSRPEIHFNLSHSRVRRGRRAGGSGCGGGPPPPGRAATESPLRAGVPVVFRAWRPLGGLLCALDAERGFSEVRGHRPEQTAPHGGGPPAGAGRAGGLRRTYLLCIRWSGLAGRRMRYRGTCSVNKGPVRSGEGLKGKAVRRHPAPDGRRDIDTAACRCIRCTVEVSSHEPKTRYLCGDGAAA
mgnify:CR=1 FL=1